MEGAGAVEVEEVGEGAREGGGKEETRVDMEESVDVTNTNSNLLVLSCCSLIFTFLF